MTTHPPLRVVQQQQQQQPRHLKLVVVLVLVVVVAAHAAADRVAFCPTASTRLLATAATTHYSHRLPTVDTARRPLPLAGDLKAAAVVVVAEEESVMMGDMAGSVAAVLARLGVLVHTAVLAPMAEVAVPTAVPVHMAVAVVLTAAAAAAAAASAVGMSVDTAAMEHLPRHRRIHQPLLHYHPQGQTRQACRDLRAKQDRR